MDGFKRPLGTNNTGVSQTTTSGFEGSPETYENVEGAPVEAVKEPQAMNGKQPGKWKKFFVRLLLALVVLGLAGAAGWFWYDGQDTKKSLETSKLELQKVQTDLAKAKSDAKKSETTAGKDYVPQTAMREAVLDSVEAFMSTKGITRMEHKVSIPYMDADFARVQVDYMTKDTSGKLVPSGKGETYYFKRIQRTGVDEAWAVIGFNVSTTEEIDSMKNRYGVPAEVITGSKPA